MHRYYWLWIILLFCISYFFLSGNKKYPTGKKKTHSISTLFSFRKGTKSWNITIFSWNEMFQNNSIWKHLCLVLTYYIKAFSWTEPKRWVSSQFNINLLWPIVPYGNMPPGSHAFIWARLLDKLCPVAWCLMMSHMAWSEGSSWCINFCKEKLHFFPKKQLTQFPTCLLQKQYCPKG